MSTPTPKPTAMAAFSCLAELTLQAFHEVHSELPADHVEVTAEIGDQSYSLIVRPIPAKVKGGGK